MIPAHKTALGAIVFVACAISCLGQTRSVALTFDDLPIVGNGGAAEARQINDAILLALAKHHAPAIGFVNEQKILNIGAAEAREILRQWTRKGQDLGNHTSSHRDLNDLTVDQFRAEVIAGEVSLLGIRRPRFLRFPYNHSGDTKEKHDAVAAFLAARGYTVATCTIDNSDYEFARAYALMIARADGSAAKKLETEYLAYTGAEIEYYTRLHEKVFGREIPHVMLLHANRLNAVLMNELLRLFETRGYRFVSLETAQSDPAYRTPDTFVTKFGPMWGYRWAQERGIRVDGRLEPQPPEWIFQYSRK